MNVIVVVVPRRIAEVSAVAPPVEEGPLVGGPPRYAAAFFLGAAVGAGAGAGAAVAAAATIACRMGDSF